MAEIRDGADGTISKLPGGLCNRFAIIVDAPTGVRVDAAPKVTDIFLQTCVTVLGIELREFGYYS